METNYTATPAEEPTPPTGEVQIPLRASVAIVFLAAAALTIRWSLTMGDGMAMPGGWTLSMVWMPAAGDSWAGAGARFVAMWIVMMLAMMLPSLVPVLERCAGPLAPVTGLGYFVVWALFGAVIYMAGGAVAQTALASASVAQRGLVGLGVIILLAGVVQASPWKARQLMRCRTCGGPEGGGFRAAFVHGMRYGMNCSLCCLGLMLALVALGMMNLAVVAAVAIAVALERLAPRPELVARVVGVVVMVSGAVVVARAL